MTSRLETSRYRDFFHFFESIGLDKFGLEKSLSIGLKKSLSISLENIWSKKKVSVSVSKIWVSKSLGIGLENLGLKKVSELVSKDLVSKKSKPKAQRTQGIENLLKLTFLAKGEKYIEL